MCLLDCAGGVVCFGISLPACLLVVVAAVELPHTGGKTGQPLSLPLPLFSVAVSDGLFSHGIVVVRISVVVVVFLSAGQSPFCPSAHVVMVLVVWTTEGEHAGLFVELAIVWLEPGCEVFTDGNLGHPVLPTISLRANDFHDGGGVSVLLEPCDAVVVSSPVLNLGGLAGLQSKPMLSKMILVSSTSLCSAILHETDTAPPH